MIPKIPPVLAVILGFLSVSYAEQTAHVAAQKLPTSMFGPFTGLPGNRIIAVDRNATRVSEDEGKTWSEPRAIFGEDKGMELRDERVILRTKDGTLIIVFLDEKSRVSQFKKPVTLEKLKGNQLHVWAARSTDEGKTWELQKIQEGYCGAIRDINQTKDGKIIVTSQILIPELYRHAVMVQVSEDDGRTWKPGNHVDVEDKRGSHKGGFEATIEELKDGILYMLVRTNKGVFYKSSSKDGLTWEKAVPTEIDATSAPALVERLADGRLVLVWNRKQAGRNELWIAFSNDEAKTWSTPVLLVKGDKQIAYPYLFERVPGELWVTSMYGNPGLKVNLGEVK